MNKIMLPQKAINAKIKNSFNVSPVYVSNQDCGIIDWLSPLGDQMFDHDTNCWYECKESKNPYPIPSPDMIIDYPIIPPASYQQQLKQINRNKSDKEPGFIYIKKIRLYPDDLQKFILDKWFAATAKIFNITIAFVQQKIFKRGRLLAYNKIDEILNARDIRAELKDQKIQIQYITREEIMKMQEKIREKQQKTQKKKIKMKIIKGPIPIHILDESITQAVSNFKSCISNLRSGKIKKFKIKPLKKLRLTKILKIESNFFKSGTFCPRVFPYIKSSESLTGIDKTCTLQYSHVTKKYILLTPTILEPEKRVAKKLSAGIDLGVTPFISVYSQNKSFSICDMNDAKVSKGIERNQKKIRKLNNLISAKQMTDNITALQQKLSIKNDRITRNEIKILSSRLDVKQDILGDEDADYSSIDLNKLRKANEKYNLKKQNKIKDMHYKTSYMLTHEFNKISVGKFCIRDLLRKENVAVGPKTKEMMKILSPFSFRQRLKHMGYKYGTQIKEVSEFLTTKTCSNCGRTKEMGGLKIYECECGMRANRDENSAKTHLKLGIMLPHR